MNILETSGILQCCLYKIYQGSFKQPLPFSHCINYRVSIFSRPWWIIIPFPSKFGSASNISSCVLSIMKYLSSYNANIFASISLLEVFILLGPDDFLKFPFTKPHLAIMPRVSQKASTFSVNYCFYLCLVQMSLLLLTTFSLLRSLLVANSLFQLFDFAKYHMGLFRETRGRHYYPTLLSVCCLFVVYGPVANRF